MLPEMPSSTFHTAPTDDLRQLCKGRSRKNSGKKPIVQHSYTILIQFYPPPSTF